MRLHHKYQGQDCIASWFCAGWRWMPQSWSEINVRCAPIDSCILTGIFESLHVKSTSYQSSKKKKKKTRESHASHANGKHAILSYTRHVPCYVRCVRYALQCHASNCYNEHSHYVIYNRSWSCPERCLLVHISHSQHPCTPSSTTLETPMCGEKLISKWSLSTPQQRHVLNIDSRSEATRHGRWSNHTFHTCYRRHYSWGRERVKLIQNKSNPSKPSPPPIYLNPKWRVLYKWHVAAFSYVCWLTHMTRVVIRFGTV